MADAPAIRQRYPGICRRILSHFRNQDVRTIRGELLKRLNDVTTLLAGGRGFEPRLTGPEPVVLPLDDPPTDAPILIGEFGCVKAICLFA
jgi:hypothetical protein